MLPTTRPLRIQAFRMNIAQQKAERLQERLKREHNKYYSLFTSNDYLPNHIMGAVIDGKYHCTIAVFENERGVTNSDLQYLFDVPLTPKTSLRDSVASQLSKDFHIVFTESTTYLNVELCWE